MTIFLKTANEADFFGFDYTDELGTDTISTSTWTIPSGLTTGAAGNDTKTTSVFLSSGSLNTNYDCVNKITSALGRIVERTFTLRIVATRAI